MGWMGGYGHMVGWTWFWFFEWIFWIALMVLVVLWIARSGRGGTFRSAMPEEDQAVAILRERYARGEIDKQEYEARLADLTR